MHSFGAIVIHNTKMERFENTGTVLHLYSYTYDVLIHLRREHYTTLSGCRFCIHTHPYFSKFTTGHQPHSLLVQFNT